MEDHESKEAQLRAEYKALLKQFLQAQKIIHHKNEFLKNSAHDMINSLSIIKGFAELMYNGELGSLLVEHKEYLGDIISSSNQLLEMIKDMSVEGRRDLISEANATDNQKK